MSRQLNLVFPHRLGAAEIRRRLDRHTDWALAKLRASKVQVTLDEWDGPTRGFAASALGQSVGGRVSVAEDSVSLDATLPLPLRPFAPAVEALARKYAGQLLAPDES